MCIVFDENIESQFGKKIRISILQYFIEYLRTLKKQKMSGTINKVMLIGHTGDEVKMHYFENGGCIARVPLATNESWTDKQTGENKSVTDWHNLIIKNKGAETFEKYVKKGHKVYVEGKLKTRKWQDNNGVDRWSTEIVVMNFTFLQSKGEGVGSQQAGSAINHYENEQKSNSKPQHAGDEFLNMPPPENADDDLPF